MFASTPDVQQSASLVSSWPHLDEQTVMNRVGALKANPDLLDQGALGLCGEATFVRHVIQRSPVLFGAMAKLLFMDGWGFVHDLAIHPDSDLRNANYGAIVAARTTEIAQALTENPARYLGPMPPQADWMILSSLCDSENVVLDFEGGPHEWLSWGSFYWQYDDWYLKSKLYNAVTKYDDNNVASIQSDVIKTHNNHIILSIYTHMIDKTATGRHIISLESPILIDVLNDNVSFDYWTWGEPVKTVRSDLTVAQFLSDYIGAVVAEF